MSETGWTAESWRDLYSLASKLDSKVEELSDRLTRIEDHLRESRTPRPQRRKHAR